MSQSTPVVLSGDVAGSWVGCVVVMVGNSYMAMFGGIFLVEVVSERGSVGSLEVSR